MMCLLPSTGCARRCRTCLCGYPGFSFGAAMAVRAAARVASRRGLSVLPPPFPGSQTIFPEQPACPWLILQGDRDELVDVEQTIEWFNGLEPGPEIEVFPDTEHFFHGKLVLLRNAVEDFVSSHGD